jgi:hypothetical protein
VLELPGQSIGALSLGPGELELIYVSAPIDAEPQSPTYQRALRSSTAEPFPAGTPLPELDEACAEARFARSGDLSLDGLRYYFVCYDADSPSSTGTLQLAERERLDAPFVVSTTFFGFVSPGPTLGPDELELITSPDSTRAPHANRPHRNLPADEFAHRTSGRVHAGAQRRWARPLRRDHLGWHDSLALDRHATRRGRQ